MSLENLSEDGAGKLNKLSDEDFKNLKNNNIAGLSEEGASLLNALSDEDFNVVKSAVKKEPEVSSLGALALGATQGLTLSYGDEALSLFAPEAGKAYKESVEAAKKQHSVLTQIGNIAGQAAWGPSSISRGAVLGAIEGSGAAEEGSRLSGAAWGAIPGAVLGLAGKGLAKLRGSKEAAKGAAEAVVEVAEDAKPLLQKGLESAAKEISFPGFEKAKELSKLAGEEIQGDIADRFLKAVKKVAGNEEGAGLNSEALGEIWDTVALGRHIEEASDGFVAALSPEVGKLEKVARSKILSGLASTKQLGDKVDDVLGTEFGAAVSKVSEALNRTKVEVAQRAQEYTKALKEIPAPKGLLEQVKWVKSAEREGNALTKLFEQERQLLNSTKGYAISKAENAAHYLPRVQTDKATIYRQVKDAMKVPELADEVQLALKTLVPEGTNLAKQSPQAVLDAWYKSAEPFGEKLLKANARMLERGAETPVLLRELNPSKLAASYLNSTYKSANLRQALLAVNEQADLAARKGMPNVASFFESYAKSITNSQGVTSEALEGTVNAYKKFLYDKLPAGAPREAAASLPDFLNWSTSFAYPNLLGLPNISAPIRNLSQTLAMTAPEIGGKYGYGLVASGYKDLAKAGWKKSIEELRRIGAHTEQKLFEAGEHATGLQSVPGKAAIDKVNHGLMILHTLTDDINRAVTQNMGKKFVKDLAEKSPEALKAFKSVPKSVQSRVNFALGEGNLEAAQDAMSNHLISKTQFIYGPAGRNKFSRAVGPALSMFTKYPSEIASDLYLSPKNSQLAAKYLAPLALAMGGQWALEQADSDTREKFQGLLGKNLTSLAPVTSVTGLVNPPPAAKLAQSAASAVDELIRERGLSGKKAAELRKAATPFVPFSGVYKKARP